MVILSRRERSLKRKYINIIIFALSIIIFVFSEQINDIEPSNYGSKSNSHNYYVSTNGDDNNKGTINSPWKTIQKAATRVSAGDTVLIRGGKYCEIVTMTTSGELGKYITFRNYPGEVVILDGHGLWDYDWDGIIRTNCKNYIRISGLKLVNSRSFGICTTNWQQYTEKMGSSHLVIDHCTTENTGNSGVGAYFCSDVVVDGNTIVNACTSGSQECITMNHVDGFEVRNNHVHDSTKEGIDAKEGCCNGKIHDNEVWNTGNVGIYIDAYSFQEQNIEVYANEVHNVTNCIATASEKGALLQNINIHNNIAYDGSWGLVVASWGSASNHPMKNIHLSNNTTYNMFEGGVLLSNADAQNIVIINNILGGGNKRAVPPIHFITGDLGEITIDHNFLSRVDDDMPAGTNYLVGDPGFVNADDHDFHLAIDSRAINAGLSTDGIPVNMGAL